MLEITHCKRCLYSRTQALGLTIDADGICSGCRVHEEKDSLDWNERWEKLVQIVKPYRTTGGTTYDCIVPVTGAQDSHWILHLVKERLGLNPLLVAAGITYSLVWGRLAMRMDRLPPALFAHALFTWGVFEFPIWRP